MEDNQYMLITSLLNKKMSSVLYKLNYFFSLLHMLTEKFYFIYIYYYAPLHDRAALLSDPIQPLHILKGAGG